MVMYIAAAEPVRQGEMTDIERSDNPLSSSEDYAPASSPVNQGLGSPGRATRSPRPASLQLSEIPQSSAIGRQLTNYPLPTLGAAFVCMVGLVRRHHCGS